MRELTMQEIAYVAGGHGTCSAEGNTYIGIADTSTVGEDIINIYEGLVAATSYIIERVANAF